MWSDQSYAEEVLVCIKLEHDITVLIPLLTYEM